MKTDRQAPSSPSPQRRFLQTTAVSSKLKAERQQSTGPPLHVQKARLLKPLIERTLSFVFADVVVPTTVNVPSFVVFVNSLAELAAKFWIKALFVR
jgi:hypothetical protein